MSNEIQKEEKAKMNLYLGIDLGTTNCSICYVRVLKNNKIQANVIKIPMFDENDAIKKEELMPSFLYFPDSKADPVVGIKAKAMLKSQPNRVIRSVKSYIGKPESMGWNIDGKHYSAMDVSAIYLKTMMKAVEKTFDEFSDDYVICVPASFDSDMRAQTLEAAKMAGIKIKDEDGPRDILLDEPLASLYDFINSINNGEVSEYQIDFSDEKTVLIYDLGGGTLDVSIHKVKKRDQETDFVLVDDLAISRYTNIGGDKFDEILANYLFEKFDLKGKLDEQTAEYEKAKLFAFAEQYKLSISNKIEEKLFRNLPIDKTSISETIQPGFINGEFYSTELSLAEYEEILKEYLAFDYQYPTKDTIEGIPEKDDLIYPIIDVLKQVYKETNEVVRPDLILVTGGMTKFYSARDRLEKFFGKKVILLLDPDKSVSRGAAIYHYYLHQGMKSTKILAETLYLKTKNGFAPLVPRGTKIQKDQPTVIKFNKKFQFTEAKKGKKYTLPFCRGEQHKEIMKKQIVLTKDYDITPDPLVSGEISIDYSKIMKFKVWTHTNDGRVKEVFEVDFDYEAPTAASQDSGSYENKGNQAIEPKKEIAEETFDPIPIPVIKKYIEDHKNKATIFKDTIDAAKILKAYNRKQIVEFFYNSIVSKKITDVEVKNAVILLLGDIIDHEDFRRENHELTGKIVLDRVSFLKYTLDLIPKQIKNVKMSEAIRYSIELIGKSKWNDRTNEISDILFKIIEKKGDFSQFIGPAFVTLGKLEAKKEILEYQIKYWDLYSKSKSFAIAFIESALSQMKKAAARNECKDEIFQIVQKAKESLLKNEDFDIINSLSRIYEFMQECAKIYYEDVRFDMLLKRFRENIEQNIKNLEFIIEHTIPSIERRKKEKKNSNSLKQE